MQRKTVSRTSAYLHLSLPLTARGTLPVCISRRCRCERPQG